ncbi:diaminopimelate dehydrogenase [Actinotignum timonense]|uniref:diaminopimelate dehydrogenase n=1 Tax=Actinotignum timonense TaxID=1870995 RepID=UPI00254EDD24|nr:diaminopimelate dehydrogenase [Actinotignum timonense]MDK6926791.1 diaminopimelate dehydrogenase [Actinotignum timonense]
MTHARIAINGYGNLGRGVEQALSLAPDLELVGVFTRREGVMTASGPAFPAAELTDPQLRDRWTGKIDVVINCGGSKSDLDTQTPLVASGFNVVDSFDTHARIPAHFEQVDDAARAAGTLALISAGWDPGLFSLQRLLAEAVLPAGHAETFWGPGLSQGHSDAVRRVPGVKNAVQYTVPKEQVRAAALAGQTEGQLSAGDKHRRIVYVVLESGADPEAVRQAIVTMPNYFAEYETEVHVISEEEFAAEHTGMAHGGDVIRHGTTSPGTSHALHFNLALDSNPEFTGAVLVACARAVARMHARGERGAVTLFDVPPALLHPASAAQLRADLL